MGLTRRQVLMRVELPLAVPAIVGGLRIAVVSTVAIATIAAFLLPDGLGYPIFLALAEPTPFKTEIYSAGLLAVALALVCDGLLVGCEADARPLGAEGRRVILADTAKPAHVRRRRSLHRRQPRPPRDEGARAARAFRCCAPDRSRSRPARRRRARSLSPRLGYRDRGVDLRARPPEPRADRGVPDAARDRLRQQHGRARRARHRADPDERLRQRRARRPRRRRSGARHGHDRRPDPAPDRAAARAAAALHRHPHRRGHDRRNRADRGDRRRRRAGRRDRQPGELPSRRRARRIDLRDGAVGDRLRRPRRRADSRNAARGSRY